MLIHPHSLKYTKIRKGENVMKNVRLLRGLIIMMILSAFLLPNCYAKVWSEADEVKMVFNIIKDIEKIELTVEDLIKIEKQQKIVDHIGYEILIRKYNLSPDDFGVIAFGDVVTEHLTHITVSLDLVWDTYEFTFIVNKFVKEKKNEKIHNLRYNSI